MVDLAPKWVRLAPNGTNPGLFQIRFQCIWRPAPNALKSDLKSPGFVQFGVQSDPLWSQTYHPCAVDVWNRDVLFGSILDQIYPKYFSTFYSASQNVQKSDISKFPDVFIWSQSHSLWSQTLYLVCRHRGPKLVLYRA